MKTLVISHNDMDGYVSGHICAIGHKADKYNNIGYDQVPNIEELVPSYIERVVISDLSISQKSLDAIAAKVKSVIIVDHHMGSMKLVAATNVTLHVDLSKSATAIAHGIFSEPDERLARIVQMVNAADIYLTDSEYFWDGVALSTMFKETIIGVGNDTVMDIRYKRTLVIEMLHTMLETDIDVFITNVLRNVLGGNNIAHGKAILRADAIESTGILINYYTWIILVSESISDPSLTSLVYLTNNSDIDGVAYVSSRGTISLRASAHSTLDVNTLAEVHLNGGGHVKAAGGKLPNTKKTVKGNIKEFINMVQT